MSPHKLDRVAGRHAAPRGLTIAPKLAIGDGALGFWNAISKVYPETRHQRCWVHKTANVLNKLPKPVQPKVKEALHDSGWLKHEMMLIKRLTVP